MLRPKRSSLRKASELAAQPFERRTYLSREEAAREYGADVPDALAVQQFANAAGLLVLETSLARRSIVLEGTAAALAAAFGTDLRAYRSGNQTFRGRVGALSVPVTLRDIVCGVFGLDERPVARAHFRRAVDFAAAAGTSFAPPQVATAYAFPARTDGTGQTIALIELGGGYAQTDLSAYFAKLGIPLPSVTSVSVDGATNAPTGDPNSADAEVDLDIEVAGAIAPGAKIVVYFSPNTDQGFLDAITTAIHDTANAPSIVSISWGGPESSFTPQASSNFDNAFADAAMLGVTVMCAAGDNGSTDGVTDGRQHCDFPASSPHVLACGGTRLAYDGTSISSEVVWNNGATGGATGGGISDAFPLPSWQVSAGVPPSANPGGQIGRGVPDVSGDADPQSGYMIRVDGSDSIVGGTSAVAPLWAALVARLNQLTVKPLGFLNAALYANPSAFNDIVSGNNGAYAASAGWDACTGLGSPNGTKLQSALLGTQPTPTPTPTPPNTF